MIATVKGLDQFEQSVMSEGTGRFVRGIQPSMTS